MSKCPTCNQEVAELAALRQTIGEQTGDLAALQAERDRLVAITRCTILRAALELAIREGQFARDVMDYLVQALIVTNENHDQHSTEVLIAGRASGTPDPAANDRDGPGEVTPRTRASGG